MNLPPLPKPDGAAPVVTDTIRLANGLTGDVESYVDAWSEPLVRAWGESCARMAREEAAKACEALADPIDSGWDECIDACAAAIRKG